MTEILMALIGPISKLIENALSDDYDKARELDAMLELEKAIYDARMRNLLKKP